MPFPSRNANKGPEALRQFRKFHLDTELSDWTDTELEVRRFYGMDSFYGFFRFQDASQKTICVSRVCTRDCRKTRDEAIEAACQVMLELLRDAEDERPDIEYELDSNVPDYAMLDQDVLMMKALPSRVGQRNTTASPDSRARTLVSVR